MEQVLDIFYNEIIKEAATGRVECYFYFNILFATTIEDKEITTVNDSNERLLVPRLVIKNVSEFNMLLIEYVKLAEEFYKDNFGALDTNLGVEKVNKDYLKSIMTLLWSNATSEDFINPCEFLRRRSAFLKDSNIQTIEPKDTSLGVLSLEIIKDQMFNETPYYMQFSINDNPLPVVRYGIYNNRAYIYAIQNITKITRDKKLNRSLYKVNEGIDLDKEGTDNILHPENLRGVTPATLLSATLAISFLKQNGINEIVLPVILPERWNAKEIIFERKQKVMEDKGHLKEEVGEYLNESYEKHDDLQRNLSDKFIRTFRRLAYHFDNIEITALPFIHDVDMHLVVSDNMNCNNPLLKEMYEIINNQSLKK